MNVIAKLVRHPPARAPDLTRNRAQPSALQLQLDSSAAARGQRNLRNSRTRDFRSSASGMEISVGMKKNNSTHRESQRVAHASRVLASASSRSRTFFLQRSSSEPAKIKQRLFRRNAETSTRTCALPYLRTGATGFALARAVSRRKIVSPSFIKS